MTYDFTLETYKDLCTAISSIQQDCRFVHYLEHKDDSRIILRHDVDRKPKNALRMAKLENKIGLKATYYFRCVPTSFDADIIHQITDMGHEIGYHYEAMSKAKGDMQKAKDIFREDLVRLRSICEIKTACMHGSPGSKHTNLQFWDSFGPEQFGLEGEAFLNTKGKTMYFTDTGGHWNSDYNLRDKLPECDMLKVRGTEDLINILKVQTPFKVYITAHPERWATTRMEGMQYLLFDASCNMAKVAVRIFS